MNFAGRNRKHAHRWKKIKYYLANSWNSEYNGFCHVKDPSELARAACLFPLPDISVYFLIISWSLKLKSFKKWRYEEARSESALCWEHLAQSIACHPHAVNLLPKIIYTWVSGLIWSTRSSDMNILGNGPLTPLPFSEKGTLGGENHSAFSFFAGNLNSSLGV